MAGLREAVSSSMQPQAHDTPAAIIVLGPGALQTARRIQACLPASHIHGLRKRVDTDVGFDDLGEHLRTLYRNGTPIIGLCAAGILIRCLSPVIGAQLDANTAKTTEPPVLAVAEDGTAVVPLLGGLSGVNTLAREIADALQVQAAITTSGELRFGQCLLDPPAGYQLADLDQGKRFVSDLLAGETVRIDGHAPWLEGVELPRATDARRAIRVSVANDAPPDTLLIHPRAVAVAVAPNLAQSIDEVAADIVADVAALLSAHGIAKAALAVVLVDSAHSSDARLDTLARQLDLPIRFIAVGTSDSQNTASFTAATRPLAALLDAAGFAAEDRRFGSDERASSAAFGIAAQPLDPQALGRSRGSLSVVGIGPGSKALLAPAAQDALRAADDILGYSTYTDMAGPFTDAQRVHGTDNREEMQRARHAFALAAQGRQVVMVSSGDPGIFAMASAVIEALDNAEPEERDAWAAVRLAIVPGISAAMACAAVAGAPLGHDFCMLSLSDNLKPWDVIEHRLRLVAEADLVMAFYNPISRSRPWQLGRALDIVRTIRHPDTPVVLGRNIDRPGASLRTVSLGELQADQVDMRTMVIIGSSTTRRFLSAAGQEWVYTPRWYPKQDSVQ